ncbi:MAG: hypothetical protein RIR36_343, partial [Bacteroidota bacterium]
MGFSLYKWTIFLGLSLIFCSCDPAQPKYDSWLKTGGGNENLKYSSLHQIDTSNYDQLGIAWIYYSENKDSTKFGPM